MRQSYYKRVMSVSRRNLKPGQTMNCDGYRVENNDGRIRLFRTGRAAFSYQGAAGVVAALLVGGGGRSGYRTDDKAQRRLTVAAIRDLRRGGNTGCNVVPLP